MKAESKNDVVTGGEAIAKVLAHLSNAMKTEMLVPAVGEVGRLLKDAMAFNAPVETGALRMSIDTKTVRYPATGNAVAITGPRRRMKFDTARGRVAPSKYAHLVEFGFLQRDGRFHAPTKPFIRPAVAMVAPRAPDMMARNLFKQMQAAAKKAGAK